MKSFFLPEEISFFVTISISLSDVLLLSKLNGRSNLLTFDNMWISVSEFYLFVHFYLFRWYYHCLKVHYESFQLSGP